MSEIEARAWADAAGAAYHEVSARRGSGVSQLFDDAIAAALDFVTAGGLNAVS